jgi:cation diffusion facilitator family transporter
MEERTNPRRGAGCAQPGEQTVLVAGATAPLGVAVVQRLATRGYRVAGIPNRISHAQRLAELGVAEAVDALDPEAVARFVGSVRPGVVVDLLSDLPEGGVWNPEDVATTNDLRKDGSERLLEAAVRSGVRRYVAESSYVVYGRGRRGEALSETARLVPPPPVAVPMVDAFRARERLVLGAAREGSIEGLVLRFGALYGVGADLESLAIDLRDGHLPAPASSSDLSWLHIDEAADAIVAAIEHGAPGGIYNIAEDEPISFSAFVGLLATLTGTPPAHRLATWVFGQVAPLARATLVDADIRLSTTKAKAELRWMARFASPGEGLAATAVVAESSQGNDVDHEPASSTAVVLVALGANVITTCGKALAAAISGSPAMLATTLHSAADTGNEVLLYLGLRQAERRADLRHPIGYGSELFFWSLLGALSMFVAGGLLSILDGIHQLAANDGSSGLLLMYGVLGAGFAVDGVSWLVSLRHMRAQAKRRNVSLVVHLRTTTDTAASGAFLEDSAALAGGLIAAAGVTLRQLLHSSIPDALAAIAIGMLLATVGVELIQRNRSLLTNRGESPLFAAQVGELLEGEPGVARVGSVIAFYAGPHQLIVIARFQPTSGQSAPEVADLVDRLSDRVSRAVPRAAAVYLVPGRATGAAPAPTAFGTDYWFGRNPDPEQS